MAFDFGAWASQKLQVLEGSLDDAFGLEDENAKNKVTTYMHGDGDPYCNDGRFSCRPCT